MARPKQMIKQIIRTVSVKPGFSDPDRGLFSNEDVESYVGGFLASGEWKLVDANVLGFEPYLNDQQAGVKVFYILERVVVE